jgi:hypothetical protein
MTDRDPVERPLGHREHQPARRLDQHAELCDLLDQADDPESAAAPAPQVADIVGTRA